MNMLCEDMRPMKVIVKTVECVSSLHVTITTDTNIKLQSITMNKM